ncbi:MAG TPA: glycosyltransferase family 2 protein [Terriglobales bacterium]|jgi:glycosyltransferase involved in cell wall biosynthesis|nr:glycosyltransferase family 2 protein [Terriglobales bacterium]
MKISIVTPSFNQSAYLGIAVQSVLDQHYPEVEHIVVDNCSTDGTLDVLRSYTHLRWSSQPDHGQSDALNQGLRLASGDIIGWLNADDLYLSQCFQTVAGIFRDRPEIDVAFGDFRWVDSQGRVLRRRREIDFDLFILKYLHVLYVPTPATFVRRRVISHGFLLDPSYHFAMDYEWFLRMALGGVKFAHVPRYFADFRIHPGSKTTLAAHRQRAEQEKALLALTPGLRRLPPRLRAAVRLSLMGAARAKRTGKKLWGGCYFEMPWRRACSP